MNALQNNKNYIALLDRKKEILSGHIIQIESKVLTIEREIEQNQKEQTYINQQIKLLTPSGILARADIYRGIRRQGSLLAHLQMITHKVTQLEEEKIKYQEALEEYRFSLNQLDKRHYKLTIYLKKLQRLKKRQRDNETESEIQELAIYDRKKV